MLFLQNYLKDDNIIGAFEHILIKKQQLNVDVLGVYIYIYMIDAVLYFFEVYVNIFI
jgi:hypothetical protein